MIMRSVAVLRLRYAIRHDDIVDCVNRHQLISTVFIVVMVSADVSIVRCHMTI